MPSGRGRGVTSRYGCEECLNPHIFYRQEYLRFLNVAAHLLCVRSQDYDTVNVCSLHGENNIRAFQDALQVSFVSLRDCHGETLTMGIVILVCRESTVFFNN